MSLRFPNESRSYDPTRRAVRFWGHDSAMEASFFVGEDALKRVQPNMPFNEAGLLGAFDANRDLIRATAARAFSEKAESEGDSHAGTNMIQASCWEEASMDGEAVFGGLACTRNRRG